METRRGQTSVRGAFEHDAVSMDWGGWLAVRCVSACGAQCKHKYEVKHERLASEYEKASQTSEQINLHKKRPNWVQDHRPAVGGPAVQNVDVATCCKSCRIVQCE